MDNTLDITVLFTAEDNKSYFSTNVIKTNEKHVLGYYSTPFKSDSIQFRQFTEGLLFPMHNAPKVQYIIYLEGSVQVRASGGETKVFNPGDILLVRDIHGKGHETLTLSNGRSLIIPMEYNAKKIISGAQTGVDRAGLDVAIELGIPHGGWCPYGRLDETGLIPEKYAHLEEVYGDFEDENANYATRTKWNIRDSDGTLIIIPELPLPSTIRDGTLLTIDEIKAQKKPYLLVGLTNDKKSNLTLIQTWIEENNIEVLNIAGPRESSSPGIYNASYELIKDIFQQ